MGLLLFVDFVQTPEDLAVVQTESRGTEEWRSPDFHLVFKVVKHWLNCGVLLHILQVASLPSVADKSTACFSPPRLYFPSPHSLLFLLQYCLSICVDIKTYTEGFLDIPPPAVRAAKLHFNRPASVLNNVDKWSSLVRMKSWIRSHLDEPEIHRANLIYRPPKSMPWLFWYKTD